MTMLYVLTMFHSIPFDLLLQWLLEGNAISVRKRLFTEYINRRLTNPSFVFSLLKCLKLYDAP